MKSYVRGGSLTARAVALPLFLALAVATCTEPTAPGSPPVEPGIRLKPAAPNGEVFVGAGDIAACTNDRDEQTAQLLDGIAGTVFTLGDNAYPNGTAIDYANCYDPTWGRHKARTYAALGNHEYDSGNADASFDYFGDRAGPRGLGYYSFDLGAWHIIVLNDNGAFVPFKAGSVQDQWLLADLASNTKQCILAIWHQPRFYSSKNPTGSTEDPARKIFWDRLYAAGVDVVLSGHRHQYERFAPMDPAGNVDLENGIRAFIVGTGGESGDTPVLIAPNSEVRSPAFGVMKFTLRDGRYNWSFVPAPGTSFTDSGSALCHGSAGNEVPLAAFTQQCTGLDCAFTDESSDPDGSIVSWSWSFGDGTTSTDQNPLHSFVSGGTYAVGLTVTDDLGASSSAGHSVTVTDPSAPAITLTATVVTNRKGPKVDLRWSGANGSKVELYRNGVKVATVKNSGRATDTPGVGTFTYKVCELGGSVCSNEATVDL